jgi:hypothetical protein
VPKVATWSHVVGSICIADSVGKEVCVALYLRSHTNSAIMGRFAKAAVLAVALLQGAVAQGMCLPFQLNDHVL